MMGAIEDVKKLLQDVIAPEIRAIKHEQEALRELMDEKFRSIREVMDERFKVVGYRFDDLNEKLDLHRRLTVVEERQQQPKQ